MFFDGSVRSMRTISRSGRQSRNLRSSTITPWENASLVVEATSMEMGYARA
jgi:hypothetical protein